MSRRRRLLAFSRHAETARQLSIALNAEGTDYQVLPGAVDCGLQAGWPTLKLVLEIAPQKLTREDILAEWPIQHRTPKAVILWRCLSRGVELGQLACEGAGHRSDPPGRSSLIR